MNLTTTLKTDEGSIGVTAAAGFQAAGIPAHIRRSGAKDLALVVNTGPKPTSAGVFTPNRFCAAPVRLTQAHVQADTITAVIINSGVANACTGAQGDQDAEATAQHVAEKLGLRATQVGVCSTGIIGVPLPMEQLRAGIDQVAAVLDTSAQAGLDAANAILTTDTVAKSSVISADGFTVGGMAKGAGMLAPALATMICVITTDAVMPTEQLDQALHAAVRTTFNRTDSDGCMSTNDTVLVLASGASGRQPSLEDFTDALEQVCASLAKQLLADAEGAAHDIAITVQHASSDEAGEAVARAIARSNLFKTAIFGRDPNWGRVVSEVGTIPESVAPYDPSQVDVTINGVTVCKGGGVGEPRELVDFSSRDVTVDVDLKAGDHCVTVRTNDLTHDYIHINADYTS